MWIFLFVLLGVTFAILAAIGALAALYSRRIRFSRGLVARSICAQSAPEGCSRTLVVAGDSTAVGVGAVDPSETVAGRIAAAFPSVRVINVSKSGACVGEVVEQLDSIGLATADLVLIQACANDTVEFRPVAKIERDLRAAIGRAQTMSASVILMPGHNFSYAPFFLRPMALLIDSHASRVHAMVRRVADETGVTFVDLLKELGEDPFFQEPHRYYCPDGLHPSGEGYALWFAELLSKGRLAHVLAPTGSD